MSKIRWLILGLLLVVPVGILLTLSLLKTEELIIYSATDQIKSFMRPASLVYLKNVRKLGSFDRKKNVPPVQFVFVGCDAKKKACTDTADWILSQGENINETDQTEFGFTALHASIVNCSPSQVKYLLLNKANPNAVATGVKYKDNTPLKFLSQVRMCDQVPEIREVLLAAGGHE